MLCLFSSSDDRKSNMFFKCWAWLCKAAHVLREPSSRQEGPSSCFYLCLKFNSWLSNNKSSLWAVSSWSRKLKLWTLSSVLLCPGSGRADEVTGCSCWSLPVLQLSSQTSQLHTFRNPQGESSPAGPPLRGMGVTVRQDNVTVDRWTNTERGCPYLQRCLRHFALQSLNPSSWRQQKISLLAVLVGSPLQGVVSFTTPQKSKRTKVRLIFSSWWAVSLPSQPGSPFLSCLLLLYVGLPQFLVFTSPLLSCMWCSLPSLPLSPSPCAPPSSSITGLPSPPPPCLSVCWQCCSFLFLSPSLSLGKSAACVSAQRTSHSGRFEIQLQQEKSHDPLLLAPVKSAASVRVTWPQGSVWRGFIRYKNTPRVSKVNSLEIMKKDQMCLTEFCSG